MLYTTNLEKRYTTKETAEIFRVDKQTVLQKYIPMGLGYIPISKRKFIFLESDINEFTKKIRQQKKILYI